MVVFGTAQTDGQPAHYFVLAAGFFKIAQKNMNRMNSELKIKD